MEVTGARIWLLLLMSMWVCSASPDITEGTTTPDPEEEDYDDYMDYAEFVEVSADQQLVN